MDEVRCEGCGARLRDRDFGRGAAYRLKERPVCAPCARRLAPSLSPDDRRELLMSVAFEPDDA